MKHQLENDTVCFVKDEAQALEILILARDKGILHYGVTDTTLKSCEQKWMWEKKNGLIPISFTEEVYPATSRFDRKIPVTEFIARLKGEWVETPANTSTLSRETRELLAGMLRDAFDKLDDTQLITSAPVLIKAASELGFNKLAKGMRDDLNF